MLGSIPAVTANSSAYTLVYFLLGFMGLFGAGGLFGVYKWAKNQGNRDAQLDRVIAICLPDEDGRGGLVNRMDATDRLLQDIKDEAQPNGGTTQRLGDIAKRSESKIDDLMQSFNQHIGESREAHAAFDRRFRDVEGKVVIMERRNNKGPAG